MKIYPGYTVKKISLNPLFMAVIIIASAGIIAGSFYPDTAQMLFNGIRYYLVSPIIKDANDHPRISAVRDIPVPDGYERLPVHNGSFNNWLKILPVKPAGTPVRYYNGRRKTLQQFHYRVIDIDTGEKDLLQCADAVMRCQAGLFLP